MVSINTGEREKKVENNRPNAIQERQNEWKCTSIRSRLPLLISPGYIPQLRSREETWQAGNAAAVLNITTQWNPSREVALSLSSTQKLCKMNEDRHTLTENAEMRWDERTKVETRKDEVEMRTSMSCQRWVEVVVVEESRLPLEKGDSRKKIREEK